MDRYIVDTNILVQFATEFDFTDDIRYLFTVVRKFMFVLQVSRSLSICCNAKM